MDCAWPGLVDRVRTALSADDDPDGHAWLGVGVAEPVGEGRVEVDAVTGRQRLFVEGDLDVEPAGEHVTVLPAVVPHQVVGAARLGTARVADAEELDGWVVLSGKTLPDDTA